MNLPNIALVRRVLVTVGGLIALGVLGLLMAGNASAQTNPGADQDQVVSSSGGGPLGVVGSLVAPVADGVQQVTAPVAGTVAQVTAPVTKTATEVTTSVGELTAPVTKPVAAVVAPLTGTAAALVAPVARSVGELTSPVTKTVGELTAPVTDTVGQVVAPVVHTVVDPVVHVVSPVIAPVLPLLQDAVPVARPADSALAPTVRARTVAPRTEPTPRTAVSVLPVAHHVIDARAMSVWSNYAVAAPAHARRAVLADPAGAPFAPSMPADQAFGGAVGTASASSGGTSGPGNAVPGSHVIPIDAGTRWAIPADPSTSPQRWCPYDHNHPS